MRHRTMVFRGEENPLGGLLLGDTKGYRYFCGSCGEVWGAVELAPSGRYHCVTWPCENHGNAYNRGGSFLKPLIWWDTASGGCLEKTLAHLSEPALVHEVRMIFKQMGI